MNTEKINIDVHDLEPTAVIEMFELDISPFNAGIFRFHPGTNGIHTNIVWQGNDYMALPMEVEGMEIKGDGTLARPTLTFANIEGYISKIINTYDDLIGLKVRKKTTYLKYLDAINFVGSDNPYGIPDPDSHFLDQVFVVNQKVTETSSVVQFELSSPMELENVILPARQVIANYCSWQYRGPGCNYTGIPIATEKDVLFDNFSGVGMNLPNRYNDRQDLTWQQTGVYVSGDVVTIESFTNKHPVYFICTPSGEFISGSDPKFDNINWKADQCSKSIYGCYLRFSGQQQTRGLPFGGFPGTLTFDMR